VIVRKEVGCNPCDRRQVCRDYKCMEAIKERDVLDAFERLMKKARA
jgi:hypothetical protein